MMCRLRFSKLSKAFERGYVLKSCLIVFTLLFLHSRKMSVETENQAHEQPLCGSMPQTEDDNLSEISEDDDDEIKAMYAKLPEDLGFTLVGMDFAECDFRTLKKLKMDLDTFLTLSEDQLHELGLKESSKLKTMFSKLSPNERIPAYRSVFWKSKVKDLRISSEESLVLETNLFTQIQELRKFLEGLFYTMSVDRPVNYMLSENYSSRDVLCNTALRAGLLARCVSQDLSILTKKLQEDYWKKHKKRSEKTDKQEVVTCAEEEIVSLSVDSGTEINTEVNSIGKLQSPKTFRYFPKCALAMTISGAFLFAVWNVSKFLISSQKKLS